MKDHYLPITLGQLQKIIYSDLKGGTRRPVLGNVSVGTDRYNSSTKAFKSSL